MAENSARIILSATDNATGTIAKVSGSILSLGQAADLVKGSVAGIGASLTVAGFAKLIGDTVNAQAKLHDLSQQTGATVEALSAIGAVAKLSDTSLEQIGQGLQKLTKNMLEAQQGSKDQAAVFGALGVAVASSSGQLRDSGDVMQDVAKSIAGLASPTERVAAAQLVFGKSGAQLIPMLNDLATAGDLVVRTTAAQAAMSDNIADNLTRLGTVYQGVGKVIVNEFLPTIDAFVESALEAAKGSNGIKGSVKDLAADGSLRTWAEEIGKDLALVVDVVQGAQFAFAQFARSSTVIFNDIVTAAKVTGAAIAGGLTDEGQAYIQRALKDRERFVEAANEDLEKRLSDYTAFSKRFADTIANRAAPAAAAPGRQTSLASLLNKNTVDTSGIDKEAQALSQLREELIGASEQFSLFDKVVERINDGAWKDFSNDTKTAALQLALEIDETKKARKAHEDFVGALKKAREERLHAGQAIQDQAAALERELQGYDQLKSAIYDKLAADAQEARILALKEGDAQSVIASLDAQIDGYQRLAAAQRGIEARDAAKKAAEDATKEWQKFSDDIERALTDSLMRGFENGKGGAQSFVDSVKNTLKTAVFKIAVQAIVDPVMGSINGLLSGKVGPGSTAGGLPNFSTSPFSDGFANLSNKYGGKLGLTDAAGDFTDFGNAVDKFAGYADKYGGYLNAAVMLSQDRPGAAVGSAIGQYFGGPIGSFIGSQIGGLLDGKRGGPKFEGNSVYDPVTEKQFRPSVFGGEDRDRAGGRQFAEKLVAGFGEGVESTIRKLGGSVAGEMFQFFGNRDTQGNAPSNIGVALYKDGKQSFVDTRNFGRSDAEFQAGTSEQLQRLMIAALKQTDLADWADAIVAKVDPVTASMEQLAAVMSELDATNAIISDMSARFKALGTSLGDDTVVALTKVMGGLDAARGALDAYYGAFYSAGEKQVNLQKQVADAFAASNVAVPQSRDAFRQLVDSLDLTTLAGQEAYAKLMRVAPAFDAVATASESAAKLVGDLDKDVARMGLTPLQKQIADVTDKAEAYRKQLVDLGQATEGNVAKVKAWADAQTDAITRTAAAQAFTGVDASGFGKMMMDSAFNPAEGKSAAETFAKALGDSVRNALISSTVGNIADTIYKAIITPLVAGQAVSQATMAATVQAAQQSLNQLGSFLAQLDLSGFINSLAPIISQISGLKPEAVRPPSGGGQTLAEAEAATWAEQRQKEIDAAKRIADERAGLEDQLAKLQGTQTDLRAKERAALDESNRAMYDHIKAIEDERAAQVKATQFTNDQLGILAQIAAVSGDTAMADSVRDQQRQMQLWALAAQDATGTLGALTKKLWQLQDAAKAIADMKETSRQIDQVKDFRGSIGDSIAGIRAQMPGYDAAAVAATALAAAQSKLSGLGADASTEQRLAAAGKVKDAIQGRYDAEIAAIERSRNAAEDAARKQFDVEEAARQKAIESANRLNAAYRSVGEYAQNLLRGNLSPFGAQQQAAFAGSDYRSLLVKAQGGDIDALGKLTGSADAMLGLAQSSAATRVDYLRTFAATRNDLSALGGRAGADLEYVQRQFYFDSASYQAQALAAQQQAIDAFTGLDATTGEFQTALEDKLSEQAIAFTAIGTSTQETATLLQGMGPGFESVVAAIQAAQAAQEQSSAVLSELQALRAELQGLRSEQQATARNTFATSQSLRRFDDGDALLVRTAA